MKNLYIAKALIKQGVTKKEGWEIVHHFNKKCVLYEKYKYASLLRISWMPKCCAITPTCSVILVLTDVNIKKDIELLYFYKNGVSCKNGKKRKFFPVYQLHAHQGRELGGAERSLPMRFQRNLKVV